MTLAAAPVREQPPAPAPVRPIAPRRRGVPWRVVGALAALCVVAAALRLERIDGWYWIDEALSVGLARHDLLDIPGLLLRDGSPPLWYLLLHVWTDVFGTSEVATHAFSVVFALAAVPVAWLVARRLFGELTAWATAAITALSPFVTYFATETRMYSMVVVLGLAVAATFVLTFVYQQRSATPWFVVSLLALLYTHNWGLYTAVACAVALVPLVVVSVERRTLLERAALAFAVVAAGYLPWVPSLLSQVENTGAPWSFTPSLRDVVRELAALFRDERILAALALAAGAGLAPLRTRWRSPEALAVSSLAVLVAVPIAIGWGVAHLEPSWATRYLAVVVGPLLLATGHGLARAKGVGVAAIAILAVLVIQPVTRVNGLTVHDDAKSNAKAVADRMAPRLGDGDVVVVAQPEAVPLFAAYLGPGFDYADPTGPVEDPSVMDWRDAEARLQAATPEDLEPVLDALAPGGRLLVVLAGNEAADTDTTWVTRFRAAGRRLARSLQADERFALVDRLRGPERPYVTFDALLFERVTD